MKKAIIVMLCLVGFGWCQQRYGGYGNRRPGLGGIASGGTIGGFLGSGAAAGANVGGGYGGAIIFPNTRPNVRPVRPGTGVSHGGVVRPQTHPGGGIGLQTVAGTAGVGVGAQQPAGVIGAHQPTGAVVGTCPAASSLVHATRGGSEYHFSWCADVEGAKYEWDQAEGYCKALGAGWTGVSIEDEDENIFVSQIIAAHELDYIWTSGQKISDVWTWDSGKRFLPLDWSPTGLDGLPQPDNRENQAEFCLAVLNNFYQDGIKWHDIACHHLKPIICERNTFGSHGVGVGVGSHGAGVGGVVNTGSANIYG